MKKYLVMILTLAMVLTAFAGCAGTPVVYYSDCTCPSGSHTAVEDQVENEIAETEAPVVVEGAVRTGLAIAAGTEAVSASDAGEGAIDFDVTLVAVLVDDNGVIVDCAIDSIGASLDFDATGAYLSEIPAEVQTKNEKGDAYGMVAYGGAVAEWYEQADALAQFAIGKTVEELKSGAVGETGYAQDADLASSATIYLGGYVSAIEKAVANALHLGAQAGDELVLTSINSMASTTVGNAQLDSDVVALTRNDGVITSCYIDALQANVAIDETGAVTIGNTLSKNELGFDYGMVAYAGATAEWFEQAASFAEYVTGKTAEEVAGIAVSEGKATDADLASSVTIAIGGFQALIAKACK